MSHTRLVEYNVLVTRRGRLFDGIAVMSVIVCLGVIGLWIASYFVSGWFPVFRGEKRCVYLGSIRGTLMIKQNVIDRPDEAVMVPSGVTGVPDADLFQVRAGPKGQLGGVSISPTLRPCWFIRIEPHRAPRMTIARADGTWVTVEGRMDRVSVSYWLILLAGSPIPIVWYRRHRLARRALLGLCHVCGYDLRGTPQRCPECGTPAQGSKPC